jgi:AMP phosphorylase
MRFTVRCLDIEAGGKSIVVLDDEDAAVLGVHPLDRVEIRSGSRRLIAIVNVATSFPKGTISVYDEVSRGLKLVGGDTVEVERVREPESIHFIREKIAGRRLNASQIRMIISDVVERHLSDVELASFITALHIRGVGMDEVEFLTRAMVETGETLSLGRKPILDKHSIGGVPGDKTTILVVPIVAAAGFVIPKSSSRAVTSPAGTADRVETLCPVDLTIGEIEEVVAKTNACMVWGGALNLAPADDILIQVEYPLSIDPLLLPSIMSKKKAMGSDCLVVDIPTGRGAKVKTIGEAHELARDFMELGSRLAMKVECAVTSGEQPVGFAIGPALEAREALFSIMGDGPHDLRDKAVNLAGILLEMVGINEGRSEAQRIIESGKAEKKLRAIIEAQGGNAEVTPEEIRVGSHVSEIRSEEKGEILWIDNQVIAQIAKAAGAPKDKGAGILLKGKIGDRVDERVLVFEIYAETTSKLEAAISLVKDLRPVGVGERLEREMLIDRIPVKKEHRRFFTIER